MAKKNSYSSKTRKTLTGSKTRQVTKKSSGGKMVRTVKRNDRTGSVKTKTKRSKKY